MPRKPHYVWLAFGLAEYAAPGVLSFKRKRTKLNKSIAKFLIALLSTVLLLSTSSFAVAATAKVGGACTKVGAKATAGAVHLVCMRVSGKLKWQKPTVTPPPAAFSTPIPIKLPVAQTGTITFDNAVANFQQIPQASWSNIKSVIASNTAANVKIVVEVGPNTQTTVERISKLLTDEFKLFSGFSQPTTFIGIAYSGQDEAWAEKEFPIMVAKEKIEMGAYPYVSRIRGNCNMNGTTATECYAGMSMVIPGSNAGFAMFGVQDPFWSATSTQAGPISQVNHEYTHNVQFAQWIGSTLKPGENVRSDSAHAQAPCWLAEGQANAIGIGVVSPDYSSYKEARDNSVRRDIDTNKPIAPTLRKGNLTAEAFTNFLLNQKTPGCYDPGTNGDYQLGYSVGMAATEALIAIGGPQSTMALYAQTANGKTWSQAFSLVFGRSWESAAAILGQVLAKEYAAEPMNH